MAHNSYESIDGYVVGLRAGLSCVPQSHPRIGLAYPFPSQISKYVVGPRYYTVDSQKLGGHKHMRDDVPIVLGFAVGG